MTAKGDYFPVGPNMYFANAVYAADVYLESTLLVDLSPKTAPLAADDNGILDDQSIASASSTTTFLATFTEAQMTKFGRCLQYVASGAATSTVTVTGYDYLGQPMVEVATLNGTTPVNGTKAFRRISSIAWGATGGTTIDVGWRDCFGLPYACQGDGVDYTSGVRSATQGSFVVRVASQTTTSGDPRGTWAPHSSVAANGTRTYMVKYEVLRTNLYGAAHVTA